MKKNMLTLIIASTLVFLFSCEGHSDDGYTNAGLNESEMIHTKSLIDSSMKTMKNDLYRTDTAAINELRREIELLKIEVKKLKK